MAKKSAVLRYLNMRAIKAGLFSAICQVPAIRDYLNYYRESIGFEDVALPGSIHELRILPARDYGLAYTDNERSDLVRKAQATLDAKAVIFKAGRVEDVTVLGSSGVTVGNTIGKVLSMGPGGGPVPRNWVIARPLRPIAGDRNITYLNLLGVRQGHRHFAHFFSDTLVPLFVYLLNWHDPDEHIVCLVREDLSKLQRDVFRFIEEDFPAISFQRVPRNHKIHCNHLIYIAFQNLEMGKDNMLARDYLRKISEFLVRHYAVEPAGHTRRIYVSRGDARLRRVANETALGGLLTKYGFESYEMGHLPFPKQMELFMSAEVIIAPHGAGLANLMFCNPGAKVLEVFPQNFVTDWFTGFAKVLGLDYSFLIAGRGRPVSMAYDIDPAALEDKLQSMGLAPPTE